LKPVFARAKDEPVADHEIQQRANRNGRQICHQERKMRLPDQQRHQAEISGHRDSSGHEVEAQ